MIAIVLIILGCIYGLIVLAADLWLRRDYNDILELKQRADEALHQLIDLIGPEAAVDLINGDARIELYEEENQSDNE